MLQIKTILVVTRQALWPQAVKDDKSFFRCHEQGIKSFLQRPLFPGKQAAQVPLVCLSLLLTPSNFPP